MKDEQPKKRLWTMVWILLILLVFSVLIAAVFTGIGSQDTNYNTAIIGINGEITSDDSGSFFAGASASSPTVIAELERARTDPQVKAIILEINSPGGSPVATDEISEEIKDIRNNNITVVAWIREEGASGAYWISTASEHIIANRMSIVGSIGVTGSYIEWYGLMNRYNVTYKRLVAGEFKDTGTPYRPMSSAEEAMLQSKLDKLHEYFISAVAANRHMSVAKVRDLATGEIFLGVEAKENGLIDELGGKREAEAYLAKRLNTTITTREFVPDKGFFERLMSAMNQNSFFMGEGIASAVLKQNALKIQT